MFIHSFIFFPFSNWVSESPPTQQLNQVNYSCLTLTQWNSRYYECISIKQGWWFGGNISAEILEKELLFFGKLLFSCSWHVGSSLFLLKMKDVQSSAETDTVNPNFNGFGRRYGLQVKVNESEENFFWEEWWWSRQVINSCMQGHSCIITGKIQRQGVYNLKVPTGTWCVKSSFLALKWSCFPLKIW